VRTYIRVGVAIMKIGSDLTGWEENSNMADETVAFLGFE